MAVTTINNVIKGNYSIEIEERFSQCDNGKPSYKLTCTDITTGQIVEEMSDTIYLSMNAVNEFINSIEEIKQPKKRNNKEVKSIKFEDLMKLFTKYTGDVRPVLNYVHFDGTHFTATNSHVLLKVNKNVVSNIPANMTEGKLFDPKNMVYENREMNYPDTSRLIPQYSDSTILINNKNIKEFHDNIKAIRKLSKKGKIVKLEFKQTGTNISGHKDRKFTEEITGHSAYMENVFVEGKELTICVRDIYLNNAMETIKKLSKLSNDHVEIRMQGHMRPIHFTQYNVFDLLVLPIRVW